MEAGWVSGRGPADRWGLGGGPAGRGLDSLRCPRCLGAAGACGCGVRGPGVGGPGQSMAWPLLLACCHRAGLTRVAARPVWSRLDGWIVGEWGRLAVGRGRIASHAGASQLMGHVGGTVDVNDDDGYCSCIREER